MGTSFSQPLSFGLCWGVEVKHGDRVERTGADCTAKLRKEELRPGAQINAIVSLRTIGPAK